MYRIFTYIFLITIIINNKDSNAQLFLPIGANTNGIAGIKNFNYSSESVFTNTANLAIIKNEFGITTTNHFGIEQLNSIAFYGIKNTKQGNFGIGTHSQQFSGYKSYNAVLGYGRSINENINIGIGTFFHFIVIPGYYNKRNISLNPSLDIRLLKQVKLGILIENFLPQKVNNAEYYPTNIVIGTLFNISSNFDLFTEIQHKISEHTLPKIGVEYRYNHQWRFRLGGSSKQHLFTFSMGYKKKKTSFNLASAYHQYLGFSNTISIGYHIK